MRQGLDEAYLRGVPEMAMFPDEETRRRAVEAIHRRMVRIPSLYVGAIVYAVIVWLVVFGLQHVVAITFGVGRSWSWGISAAVVLVAYGFFVSRSLRRGVVHELRDELLRCGVPVCVRCGYDLRGGPRSADPRCPECGHRLSGKARRLVTVANRGGHP